MKLDWRSWILLKLSFRELYDWMLPGLHPFDNIAI